MSGGRSVKALPSTLVRVTTDDGVVGWGETCPLGPTYLEAHAEGARAALRQFAPALIGADPSNLHAVQDAMDGALRGHAYAKSAVDIACWDVLGRALGVPVSTLLARRDLDGAGEDLGPARGHALDRQLEQLGGVGAVVDADDEARVGGGVGDRLGHAGAVLALGHADRDADGVPMPSCDAFAEH